MSGWTRRAVLSTGGAAAVAVPMSALVATTASATTATTATAGGADASSIGDEPVMFVIEDAGRGEIAVLHGEHEVTVRDRDLVARIAAAAAHARKGR